MNQLYRFLLLLVCLSVFQACQKEEVMYWRGDHAVNFLAATYNLSFIQNIEAEKDVAKIPVLLMGNKLTEDMEFGVEVVTEDPDDEDYVAADPSQYKILSSKVLAGDTLGYIQIEVLNPEKQNLASKTQTLRLKLVDKGEMKAGGWRDFLTLDFTWSSDLVQPYTWKSMRWFLCGNYYSSNVYRAYIAATGLYEMYYSLSPNPETGETWSEAQCYVLGKKFGDWVRKWNEEHYPEVYCHDDGKYAGQPIVPLY